MTDVEFVSFDELEPEISWIKGGPGPQTGGPPPRAFWRPLVTWRRMIRTIIGVHLAGGVRRTITFLNVQPAVNRQPSYRWEDS